MPHFDQHGRDTWLCQHCAKVFDSTVQSVWTARGNACPTCAVTLDKWIIDLDARQVGGDLRTLHTFYNFPEAKRAWDALDCAGPLGATFWFAKVFADGGAISVSCRNAQGDSK